MVDARAGLTLAAAINGLFSWLSGEVTRAPLLIDASGLGSGGYTPWPALVLSALVAIVLFGIIFLLMSPRPAIDACRRRR